MHSRPIRVLAVGVAAAATVGLFVWLVWPTLRAFRRVGPLVEMLSDADEVVRVQAAKELQRLGPAARMSIPALIAALGDENFNVRWRAADALGAMGPVAQTSVPALSEALKDVHPFAALAAADALRKIDPAAARRAGLR